jgi:hypothetical protein
MPLLAELEKEDMHKENEIAYRRRFIEVLGDPSKWSYTGQCSDAGRGSSAKCICGDGIR